MSIGESADLHEQVDHVTDDQPTGVAGPVGIAVRHDVRVPAVVALGSAVLTVLWFSRALDSGSWLDWLWVVVPASVGLAMLLALRDSRAPLLVADDHGVRVRRGLTWTGVRWSDVDRVEVRGRGGALRDGALVVHVAATDVPDPTETTDEVVDPSDHAGPAAPARATTFEVPLGLGTRVEVDGLSGNLVEDLDSLAAGQAAVVVLTREVPVEPSEESARSEQDVVAERDEETARVPVEEPAPGPGPEAATSSHDDAGEQMITVALPGEIVVTAPEELPEQRSPDQADQVTPPAADHTTDDMAEHTADHTADEPGLEPEREVRGAARAEVVRESVRRLPDAPAIPAQRSEAGVVTARVDQPVEPLPAAASYDLTGPAPSPVLDPVIGPLVAAARQRARLSIDTLSERTRIRPHVLECLEVDDFAACGGDFYARGHLRTLARVFGLDAEELVRLYDEHYAGTEIEARQVFEAELASGIGGGVRTATSGPRWSALAAAVLVLVAIWGTARVFSDDPQELVSPAPDVVDTAGLAGEEPEQVESALAAIRFTAEGAGSQVVVRDGTGRILWVGRLADGQSQQIIGTAPFDVTASNGSAVRVGYLGKDRGTVGETSEADNRRFGE